MTMTIKLTIQIKDAIFKVTAAKIFLHFTSISTPTGKRLESFQKKHVKYLIAISETLIKSNDTLLNKQNYFQINNKINNSDSSS